MRVSPDQIFPEYLSVTGKWYLIVQLDENSTTAWSPACEKGIVRAFDSCEEAMEFKQQYFDSRKRAH